MDMDSRGIEVQCRAIVGPKTGPKVELQIPALEIWNYIRVT